MKENITTVKFAFSQRRYCNDVYKGKNGRYYVRSTVHHNRPDIVEWLSGTPHTEGIEPDCPIKAGWTIRATDETGAEYEESIYKDDNWGAGIANKAHPFSWEMEDAE